ncbi:MAG: hypothetical protein QF541_24385, partial [Lentisphaeria bacterium]|nr:hypothetical protein [Lentisphaeria bacterium]
AVGITVGLDLGIGSRGIVITRGIAEATRLGAALGAHPQTFAGLAGVVFAVPAASVLKFLIPKLYVAWRPRPVPSGN